MNPTIRILHMYHDLMNLYGDWANAAILAREIEARGASVEIDRFSVGDDVDIKVYDFIYIGSGTEKSQRACMSDLRRYAEYLSSQIEAGVCVLATGNSHELFGRSVTVADGGRYEALGLLGFETLQQDMRVTGDCICRAGFITDKLVGFINRAGGKQEGDVDRPFTVESSPGGADNSYTEGIMYKNLLGTYMTGPVLVRNPPLLRYIADVILPSASGGREGDDPFFAYQEEAYRMALSELSARV